jgi:hypothetical protein
MYNCKGLFFRRGDKAVGGIAAVNITNNWLEGKLKLGARILF